MQIYNDFFNKQKNIDKGRKKSGFFERFGYSTRKASESTRFADMFAKSIGICDYKAVKALKVT